ncbi:MAG: hypothetical protein HY273_01885 [Gammaproteobacteria bacterium]|nr:hypothetical protein [Gammaproteobacteria bacterium]
MNDTIPPLAVWLKANSAERKAAENATERNIPTLNTRAIPAAKEEDVVDAYLPPEVPAFDPVLIGPERGGLNSGEAPPETQLSGEDIRQISEKLRSVLLPEIDKVVSYAMNHAFAYAMDQATHILREKVHVKIKELLPKLVEDAIRNPTHKSK